MAGHSKWNNIKNRKGAVDAKRGKLFGQLAKAIRISVKEGKSGDPKANTTLRLLLDKARAANMPKEKIQKAIDVGLGKNSSGVAMQEVLYEGFGPGGVGLLIQAITDNAHRTSSEIRFLLSRAGGNLSGPGSAAYLFQRSANDEYTATIFTPLEDLEQRTQLVQLIENLRQHDDVEGVYYAVDLPEEGEADET